MSDINATKAIDYLRRVGIEIPEDQAMAWIAQEAEHRTQRRRHTLELKRSCGHFSTHWCKVVDGNTNRSSNIRYCNDCGRPVEMVPINPQPPKRRKYA